MEPNPDVIEDQPRGAYTDREQGATISRQTVAGGAYKEGTDIEAGQPMDYSNQPHVTVTTQQTIARQTVRPSPTHANVTTQKSTETRSGGGFLHGFTTKTRGHFFFPLHAAIAFFSFMVFVSSALIEDRASTPLVARFVQYEMLIAQLSFAISVGSCVMERVGLLENRHLRVALSAFSVFFWAPALVIMTFYGSYLSPLISANGFFGAWGAFLASVIIFSHETERSRPDARLTAAPRTSLLLLFFTSLMIMGAGIRVYYNRNTTSTPGGNIPSGIPGTNPDTSGLFAGEFTAGFSYTVFAIAFGAITAFLSIVFLAFLDAIPPAAIVGTGIVFFLWVAVGALVLTFADPFEQAWGNGYYSVLFCLLASFGLLISLRQADRERATARTTEEKENAASAGFFLFMRGLAVASLVVLVASTLVCRNSGGCSGRIPIFQVCAGAVSLGISLIVVILEFFGLYRVHAFVKMAIAFILWAWWVGAFIVLTFYGDFQSPTFLGNVSPGNNAQNNSFANGFFFTWVALVFSSLAFAEALKDRARDQDPPSPLTAKTGFLLLVIVGSAIELGAAIKWYYDTNFAGISKYAISLGCVSIGMILILYLVLLCVRNNYDAHDSIYNIFLYFLTLWWAVGALIVTYMGLWNSAFDNGYFSVFFTLGTCLLALSGIWRTEEDDDDVYYNNAQDRTTTNRPSATAGPAGTTAGTTTSAARY